MAEGNLQLFFRQAVIGSKQLHALLCLLELLLLQHRQVHGYISAVCHCQRFYHVQQ